MYEHSLIMDTDIMGKIDEGRNLLSQGYIGKLVGVRVEGVGD